MLALTRCTRTGGRSSTGERPPRPAHHLRGGAPRRLLAGLVVAAAGVAGATGGVSAPALAAWTGSVQASTTLSMATLSQSWSNLDTAGTVGSDQVYTLRGLLAGNTGYVDLVNTSTTTATLSATVTMATVVGGSYAQICSVPWNTATGECTGTLTTPNIAAVVGGATGVYTTPTPIAPGGRIRFKVRVVGVAGSATLTPVAPLARPAADRTTS